MTSDILKQYTILVDFLGTMLGPDYEIVLQDLAPDTRGIIAMANGHISGRTIGSPLTNAALQMLSSKAYKDRDFICNYKGIAENGHVLRSSTMFIKDENDEPVGLLCINFDDHRYTELHEALLHVIHPQSFAQNNLNIEKYQSNASPASSKSEPAITENFTMDIPTLMQHIFSEAVADLTTPVERLNQNERKEIISKLHQNGLFQLKGAIHFVSKKFSCSTATIYRYLSEITN